MSRPATTRKWYEARSPHGTHWGIRLLKRFLGTFFRTCQGALSKVSATFASADYPLYYTARNWRLSKRTPWSAVAKMFESARFRLSLFRMRRKRMRKQDNEISGPNCNSGAMARILGGPDSRYGWFYNLAGHAYESRVRPRVLKQARRGICVFGTRAALLDDLAFDESFLTSRLVG